MATEPIAVGQKTGTGSDSYLSRAVVDARLATAEEIKAALAKQQKLNAAGTPMQLAEVLVRHGIVTASQLKRLANPADDSMSAGIQQIPGFQIMQKVGAGAMASVYKAKQLSLDRIVAIKILPKRLSEDPEFVKRFYAEGRAAAKLNHNNIVQAIDVGEFAGYHYFVMEYIDGKTVYDELIAQRVYNEKAALSIVTQVAQALEHAHAKGFIHRDVKPKNIMITKDGTAKLADMGLARQASDVEAAEAEKGRAYGTPYYISPEQIRGVVDVDFRADIYSLGATFYHMITGKVPFEGATPSAIMHKHLKEPLIPPDHLNTSLSTGLAEIVERAMAKDRDQRYLSTTDLLVDLERVSRGEAPLQARSGYNDKMLETLADRGGAAAQSYPDEAQELPLSAPRAANLPLILAVIGELVVILILLIVLIIK
ncbi:MAG TPA: serine/threonine-protein kinase [Phycisphaerae bacterium]|nr:serine/threonine-protein kinase [Phycisphaerae bacterium]